MATTIIADRILDVLCAPTVTKIRAEDNGNQIEIDRASIEYECESPTDLTLDLLKASKQPPGIETVLKYGGNVILVVAGWQG